LPGYEDVKAICAPLALPAEVEERPEKEDTAPEAGYVYLLKSGKLNPQNGINCMKD
jgi:hypothetical protein